MYIFYVMDCKLTVDNECTQLWDKIVLNCEKEVHSSSICRVSSDSACVVTKLSRCTFSKKETCVFLVLFGKHVKWINSTLSQRKASAFPIFIKMIHEIPKIRRWHLGKFYLRRESMLRNVGRMIDT